MSRMAQELESYLRDMRAKSAKENRGKGQKGPKQEAGVENRESDGNQLTSDTGSANTDVDLSQQQGQATGSNDAAGASNSEEGTPTTMSKKAAGGGKKKAAKEAKPKAVKTPKAPKEPKAPKGERKPREKKLASGKLKKVEATGNTYITLEFEEGKIVLTPTGNREQNRDLAVKALRSLL